MRRAYLKDGDERLLFVCNKNCCRDQGRVWDRANCQCRCPLQSIQPCSTGFVFDEISTCSCVSQLDLDNDIEPPEKRDAPSEYKDIKDDDDNNFELIIIIALSVVCSVFFLMILSLVNNVSNLRRIIRNLQLQAGDRASPLLSGDRDDDTGSLQQ